ncbi:MAG: hypothetical protein AB7O84_17280 [Planctomycetota bacterium]
MILSAALALAPSAAAQERQKRTEAPTFTEALDQARAAVAESRLGGAISALQAAIRDLQKQQRTAILAALPTPEGFAFKDPAVKEIDEQLAAGVAAVGLNVRRRYRHEDGRTFEVEVTANSPVLKMMSMVFSNPAMVQAQGGELVKYGDHKAILKEQGERVELQLMMHEEHLLKVEAQGLTGDQLLAIFDQAFVDRLEKPLGR